MDIYSWLAEVHIISLPAIDWILLYVAAGIGFICVVGFLILLIWDFIRGS